MLPYKYKTGKFIEIEKKLKDYFNKYYGKNSELTKT